MTAPEPSSWDRLPACHRSDATDALPDPQLTRRGFVQVLGAGLLISVTATPATAQRRRREGGGGGSQTRVSARIHVGRDGTITVLSGKIEMGQGARGELSQAAAEELRVPLERIQVVMGDTSLVPDDGVTAGSRTTPSTVPAVRRGAAAARRLLVELACRRWQVAADQVDVRDGQIAHAPTQRSMSYAELAADANLAELFDRPIADDVELTPVTQWRVMGSTQPRPGLRDYVTGAHKYPSDLAPPGTLRGKVLRPPSYGARLVSVDLSAARAMEGVVAVHEDQFAGVAAPTTSRAEAALRALATSAVWQPAPHPSSSEIFDYLRQHARDELPRDATLDTERSAHRTLRRTYHIPYVQHAPMETRTALAEWRDGRLTVWTGTQSPFGYHRELTGAFGLAADQVRVIVPDFGCGFGGKHTAEAAIEAARLARAAGAPVSLHWTREEEFTWAYFRPAAVIDVAATLDPQGTITAWNFININSGQAAIDTPYHASVKQCRYVPADSPLRQGSYRVLAATANNFARECFIDELAELAGVDPLEYRLTHLRNDRIRAVLEVAADRFGWREKYARRDPQLGVGLACGTEKNSVVATCAEVALDREKGTITVRHVCEVFECGAIINPDNLSAQVTGCMIMGLGPALREEMKFDAGQMRNARFSDYAVPRFSDIPTLDIHLLNRPDLESAGGGETPIIAIAPAIASAIHHATTQRNYQLPLRCE